MELMFMIFMTFVCIFCLFAIVTVARDMIVEDSDRRKQKDLEKRAYEAKLLAEIADAEKKLDEADEEPVIEEIVEETVVEEEPIAEPEPEVVSEPEPEIVAEPEPVAEEPEVVSEPEPVIEEPEVAEEPVVVDENAISFSLGEKETLEQKYLALTQEYKEYYDEIAKHAMMKEGSKRFKTEKYGEYKIGKNRLVRLTIKKGIVNCEFILYNSDFKNYINDKKVSVKQAPTTVKVTDHSIVQVAKDSIDIAIQAFEEEKE